MVKHVNERSRLLLLGIVVFCLVSLVANMERQRVEGAQGNLRFEFYSDIARYGRNQEASQHSPTEELTHRQRQEQKLARTLRESYKIGVDKAAKFATWILDAHAKSGVPVGHIAALLATESSFRYQARSHVGAIGPAQVVPRFWSDFCEGRLDDPDANVTCGARVLAHYRDTCPDWHCAFQKYNVGPRGYRDPRNAGAIKRYIAKIQSHQAQLRKASSLN